MRAMHKLPHSSQAQPSAVARQKAVLSCVLRAAPALCACLRALRHTWPGVKRACSSRSSLAKCIWRRVILPDLQRGGGVQVREGWGKGWQGGSKEKKLAEGRGRDSAG